MEILNHHAIDNGDVEVHLSDFKLESNSESVLDTDNKPIKSIDDDKMDHLLELFHSEHVDDILDVDLQMLHALLVVAPPSKFYPVFTVLFHRYGGENVYVTNCMSHFLMIVSNRST